MHRVYSISYFRSTNYSILFSVNGIGRILVAASKFATCVVIVGIVHFVKFQLPTAQQLSISSNGLYGPPSPNVHVSPGHKVVFRLCRDEFNEVIPEHFRCHQVREARTPKFQSRDYQGQHHGVLAELRAPPLGTYLRKAIVGCMNNSPIAICDIRTTRQYYKDNIIYPD